MKVLDFGLAKALDTAPEGDPSQSPDIDRGGHADGCDHGDGRVYVARTGQREAG